MKKIHTMILLIGMLQTVGCKKSKDDNLGLLALAGTGAAPTISYAGSPFTFTQNIAITAITPTLTGDALTGCSSSPALPTGLVISGTTCAISGTATVTQNATAHTITASNAKGNGTANISIAVTPPAGTQYVLTTGGVTFKMVYVPGGLTTPTGLTDATTATVANAYTIAETPVTYELWNTVYVWGLANGYTFSNAGHQGGDQNGCPGAAVGTIQHPVTCINWRDAMVWTNALTEYYNAQNGTSYAVVYTSNAAYTTPLRDSRDSATCKIALPLDLTAGSCDNPYVNPNAKGFRLPSDAEYELAARYKGSDSTNGAIEKPLASGKWWTPGQYASGATLDWTDFAATNSVVWFGNIVDGANGNTITTQPVKTKAANALGLYDMSGNVWEWDFDWESSLFNGARILRGGSWNDTADNGLRVGNVFFSNPFQENFETGFRPARSAN